MLFFETLQTLEDKERELVAKLYEDYSKNVKRLAMAILHDEKAAEDAVNDTFIKVIKYRDKFTDNSDDENKRLMIIYTRSVCFNVKKRKRKVVFDSYEETFPPDMCAEKCGVFKEDDNVLGLLIKEETSEYLQKAIETLNEPARDFIILKYYYDMKNTDIAELYDENVGTVGTVIFRGKEYLKKALEDYLNGEVK